MKAAVCDNEQEALDATIAILKKTQIIKKIRGFTQMDHLRDALSDGEIFDVVFMDIDWNQDNNGIDFAAELNRESPCTQIIYVTGYNDLFSQKIFLKPSNLCGYLVKPIDENLLAEVLNKAWNNLQIMDRQKLLIPQKGIIHAVPFCTIYYLESQGHKLTIHTVKDRIICYERLEEIKLKLPRNFYQCHKSYLINFDFIKRIDKNRIIMKNEAELPISKSKYANTHSEYFLYMGDQL